MGWTRVFRDNEAKGKRTLGGKGRIAVGFAMFALGGLTLALNSGADQSATGDTTLQSGSSQIPSESGAALQAKRGSPCGVGGHVTQVDFAVKTEGVLRQEPSAQSQPVMFKAGDEQIPAPLELSSSIRQLCVAGAWSKIYIVSLLDQKIAGWVPTDLLRKVRTTSAGRRIYQADDFEWPEGSEKARGAVVKLANRIMDQRPECLALYTDSLVLNPDREGGKFSLPCFTADDMLSFDFHAADAATDRSFEKVDPLAEDAAWAACRSAILDRVSHPSTVDFSGYDYRNNKDGDTSVTVPFSAKNSFGLELRFEAWCRFTGAKLTDISISEADE